ncbi:hypothetical protein F442_02627 [Phytophthora nicotianae P10297]|uniref:Uncharacterized protein n=2 Tax=Phytophthora nicotianae TaxID=4792 RepID=W3A1C4_PHYNI|nr:hypothetical protein L917_02442 [Phytophthora nicotianae]ETP52324.1 hypothetical protein F442_02627 [Phytophthora nicotianae P10297]
MSYEAKPLTTTSVAKAATSEEEQQTQSMMYAARMTYLDNSEQRSPDPMFLTRKQAQKMAQQQQEGLKMPFRRLEKMNTARATNGPTVISWKKSKAAMAALEKHKTWKPRFQAGCHFYECVETGECRVYPQGNPALMPSDENKNEADSDDDDPPFPDSFAFLNDSRK